MNDSTTSGPTPEQQQRAKWDLLLLDIELRTQQVIQMKRFETWKALATLLTAAVVSGGAIAGGIWAVITWTMQHWKT